MNANRHTLDQFLVMLRQEVFGMNEMIRDLQKSLDRDMLERLQKLEAVAEAAERVCEESRHDPADERRFVVDGAAIEQLDGALARPEHGIFDQPLFAYDSAERDLALAR